MYKDVEKQKQYRERHREIFNARDRNWRRNNPANAAQSRKNWRLDNPEKSLGASRNWKRNNYAHVLAYNAARRAKRRGIGEHFTAAQVRQVLEQFNFSCFKCKSIESPQIDHHMPLVLGHALEFGNAVVLCKRCNSSKRDRLPEVFYTETELAQLRNLLEEQKFLTVDR
jgi:5-methylcytosine-specific restriction endonuclease McrA